MIIAHRQPPVSRVAAHYERLDRFRPRAFGEDVHHGLWQRGDESIQEACLALSQLVAIRAGASKGLRICDVGSGYGGMANLLVRDFRAQVSGYTVSSSQYERACETAASPQNPRYVLGDWLDNSCAEGSFEAVIAVESTEHFQDKPAFFREAYRVLAPGGRLVVASWLTRDQTTSLDRGVFLRPILREHGFAGLGSAEDYRALYREAGFGQIAFERLSDGVARTWRASMAEASRDALREPSYRKLTLAHPIDTARMILSTLRLVLAYGVGALQYGLFVGRKEAEVLPETRRH